MPGESWKRMALRALPAPEWLRTESAERDVVLSSRFRVMRNLAGHRFPNRLTDDEARETMETILDAAKSAGLGLEAHRSLTPAERDHWVSCRLISPEFAWMKPGRALLLDPGLAVSVMVNEEDHVRLQALTGGWSAGSAEAIGMAALRAFDGQLAWAQHPRWGYMAASAYNAGSGLRRSAMFHLIGLAQTRRLAGAFRALAEANVAVRGLFGESSRAIGAFVQVSTTSASAADFAGACEYLIREERAARHRTSSATLRDKVSEVREYVQTSREVDLANAFRALAWLRWGAVAGLEEAAIPLLEMDRALSTLDPGSGSAGLDGRERAIRLRAWLNL